MIFNKVRIMKVGTIVSEEMTALLSEWTGSERSSSLLHGRVDRSTKDRGQRTRKLQLSDVDW